MYRLKSVGVMSVAKIMGLLYGAMGLLFVPIFLVAAFASALATKGNDAGGSNVPAALGPIFAIVLAILAPVIYGLMGFVAGAMGALLYNLMAHWVGGFEIEMEVVPVPPVAPAYQNLPPSPPQSPFPEPPAQPPSM